MKIFIITKIFGYCFFFLNRLLFLFIVRSKPSVDHRAQSYPCSLARTLFVSFPPIATRVSSSLPSFLPSFLCFFLPFHPRGALQTAASRSLDLCTPHAPSSTWCVPPSRRYNRIGVTYPSPPDKLPSLSVSSFSPFLYVVQAKFWWRKRLILLLSFVGFVDGRSIFVSILSD